MFKGYGYFGFLDEPDLFIDFLKDNYKAQAFEEGYRFTMKGAELRFKVHRNIIHVLLQTGTGMGTGRGDLINMAKEARKRNGLKEVRYYYHD